MTTIPAPSSYQLELMSIFRGPYTNNIPTLQQYFPALRIRTKFTNKI